jgi:hypothetical protein
MTEGSPAEPAWVQRMRAAGYNIRIGNSGEPMSEIPEAFFYPPPGMRHRLGQRIAGAFRRVFRANASTRANHAPLP